MVNKEIDQNESTPTELYSHKEMQALFYGAKAILKHHDFESAAKQIFDTCKELIGATAGYIALLSTDSSENEVLFLDSGGMNCTVDPSLPMPIRGLREQAYRLCQPVYHNDFSNSPWIKYMPEGHVYLQNVLFAPLVHGGKAVGLLGISNKNGGFNDHDAELASAFSEYAAIALYNSRNLEKLTQAKSELESLNNILEKKVQERTKEITKLLKQKDDFIQQLGHDLKNPLGPLITILPLLKEACDKPKYCEMIDVLSRNANYMKNLVQKTLELGQLDSPNTHFKQEAIHIKTLINEIVQSNKEVLEEKNIQIFENIPDELYITIDKKRLKEVIENLLDNAIIYQENEGNIHIDISQKESNIKFSIKDTGIGLTEEQLNHVFDEFYKADDSRHDFTNTGLGLSITKKIIGRFDGAIWVESEGPGQGSTFSFTIPKEFKKISK